MGDAFRSALAIETAGAEAAQISNLYLGAMIVVNCAFCLTPVELFLVEIWPRHGFFSLLLFVAPLIVGCAIARVLPERYYRIRHFESSGRVYERIGIRFFKRFVPNGDYINQVIRRSQPGYRVVHDRDSIVNHEAATRWAERCHIVSLFLVVPCTAYALMLGWNKFALWLVLPNIPLHLYPILLQRYTRARIQNVLRRRRHGLSNR